MTRYSPGNPRPDHTVGKKKNKQKGDNIYNNSGAGQKITVKAKPGNGHSHTSYGEEPPLAPSKPAGAMQIGDLCPDCGEAAVVNEEGCRKCYACGYSEC